MTGTVIFLGAGATKSVGGPLTNEILKQMLYGSTQAKTPPRLREFVEKFFHVNAATPLEQFPDLPLLMSLLDTSLDRRQAFHPDWQQQQVSDLRRAIEIGMFDLLEETLEKVQTKSHSGLLNKIYPQPTEPCVISTNYDLIIDTAMMSVSESRTPEGGLPRYYIPFRTAFYGSVEARSFGTLLKLHGSLNWLHCRTCQRMEFGRTVSRRYVKVLARLLGDIDLPYEPGGDECPSCGAVMQQLMIAPTRFKDYRNPHLAQVWYEAERVLREATKVTFIGYSLPDDDVEVVYLLKRSLAHLTPEKITVVEFDRDNPQRDLRDHAVGRRYRTLFGDGIDWHADGVDDWLNQLPVAQANAA
jgi:hypothetical protein